jgi:hypothetical protein
MKNKYKLTVLPTNSQVYRIYKLGPQDNWIGVGYYYLKNKAISGSFAIGDMMEIVNCCNEVKLN